jgi:uncharacterized protein
MGIPIEQSFVVRAPASAVWELLTDPQRVASCLPGAAITGKLDDQSWSGTMSVKVGPVVASYRGKLRFERLDAATGEAEISAAGQETRGKGGADMRMKSRVVARSPGETEVTVTSDVNVVGILAQFGRGMIQDVSDQLFQKFTEGVRKELEAAAPPIPPAATTAAVPATAAPVATPPGAARPPHEQEPNQNVLDVGALGATAARRAVGRTVRRPGFWMAAAVIAGLIYLIFFR